LTKPVTWPLLPAAAPAAWTVTAICPFSHKAPEALAVVDAVVGAVEVVDGTVVEVLAPVVVLEWLTVDVGAVVGDPPQETRPRVKAASTAIVALRRITPPLYQVQ
jgi:hypothetical protein